MSKRKAFGSSDGNRKRIRPPKKKKMSLMEEWESLPSPKFGDAIRRAQNQLQTYGFNSQTKTPKISNATIRASQPEKTISKKASKKSLGTESSADYRFLDDDSDAAVSSKPKYLASSVLNIAEKAQRQRQKRLLQQKNWAAGILQAQKEESRTDDRGASKLIDRESKNDDVASDANALQMPNSEAAQVPEKRLRGSNSGQGEPRAPETSTKVAVDPNSMEALGLARGKPITKSDMKRFREVKLDNPELVAMMLASGSGEPKRGKKSQLHQDRQKRTRTVDRDNDVKKDVNKLAGVDDAMKPAPTMKPPPMQARLKRAPVVATTQLVDATQRMHSEECKSLQTQSTLAQADTVIKNSKIQDLEGRDRRARTVDRDNDVKKGVNKLVPSGGNEVDLDRKVGVDDAMKPAPTMKPPPMQARLKRAPAVATTQLVDATQRMHSEEYKGLQIQSTLAQADTVIKNSKIQDLEGRDRRARTVDRDNDVSNDINMDHPDERAKNKRDKGGSSSRGLYHPSPLEASGASVAGDLEDVLKREGVPLFVAEERVLFRCAFKQFHACSSTAAISEPTAGKPASGYTCGALTKFVDSVPPTAAFHAGSSTSANFGANVSKPATFFTFEGLRKVATVAAAGGKDSGQPATAFHAGSSPAAISGANFIKPATTFTLGGLTKLSTGGADGKDSAQPATAFHARSSMSAISEPNVSQLPTDATFVGKEDAPPTTAFTKMKEHTKARVGPTPTEQEVVIPERPLIKTARHSDAIVFGTTNGSHGASDEISISSYVFEKVQHLEAVATERKEKIHELSKQNADLANNKSDLLKQNSELLSMKQELKDKHVQELAGLEAKLDSSEETIAVLRAEIEALMKKHEAEVAAIKNALLKPMEDCKQDLVAAMHRVQAVLQGFGHQVDQCMAAEFSKAEQENGGSI